MLKSNLKSSVYAINRLISLRLSHLDFFAIRGFPKSGTNWLGNLMRLHPEISITGEWGFNQMAEGREFILQQAKWTASHGPHMRGALDKTFERMIKTLLVQAASSDLNFSRIKCLGDQTPSNAYPPIIKKSKCLDIVRDVRDVIVSRAYHLLRVNGTWGLHDSPAMLQNLESHGNNLQYFKDHPEKLLEDVEWVRKNVQEWAKSVNQVLNSHDLGLIKLYPDYTIKILRYEDLHLDIEAERKSCYSFLGLDPNKCLPLDSGSVKTSPGFDMERPHEFYRKGAVGDWRNYFSEAATLAVIDETASLVEDLGYPI